MMMNRGTGFALAVLLLGVAPASAQNWECDEAPADLVRTVLPDLATSADAAVYRTGDHFVTLNEDALYLPACRQWPAHPNLRLLAIPLLDALVDPAEDIVTGDLLVSVIDPSVPDGAVARVAMPDFFYDDAVYTSRIVFDTAPYRLIDGDLAFGLRAERRTGSRPNPFHATTLYLFQQVGNDLRMVLDGMTVEQMFGETDTNCAGQFDTLTRVLDLGDNAQNGGTDIVVTTTETTEKSEMVDGDCLSEKEDWVSKTTLRYDGTRYTMPRDMMSRY